MRSRCRCCQMVPGSGGSLGSERVLKDYQAAQNRPVHLVVFTFQR